MIEALRVDPWRDLPPLLAAVFAALSCGLLGNFLVLRRLSMMGDAISHSVLPGLVAAFLIAGTRSSPAMFIGAAIAGLMTVGLVSLVRSAGRVESGAAMGVVFSVLFALGVLLLEQAAARNVDLDADCVLHGQLEFLFAVRPAGGAPLLSVEWLRRLPGEVYTLAVMTVVAIGFMLLCFKELRIVSFDPELAASQGISPRLVNAFLMVLVAAATVASFKAVGSILVIAMLVCPAATARLLTDRLHTQVIASGVIALIAAIIGFFGATAVPRALGLADDVNTAGAMTVALGLFFAVTVIVAPRHGVIAGALRRVRLGRRVLMEDLLGTLYRAEEREAGVIDESMSPVMRPGPTGTQRLRAEAMARRRGLITGEGEDATLTSAGRTAAADLVRRHRLWESYLVQEAGLRADHVHDPAETLEHLRDEGRRPIAPTATDRVDPHGKPIPGGE